jgi:hypothetical protein
VVVVRRAGRALGQLAVATFVVGGLAWLAVSGPAGAAPGDPTVTEPATGPTLPGTTRPVATTIVPTTTASVTTRPPVSTSTPPRTLPKTSTSLKKATTTSAPEITFAPQPTDPPTIPVPPPITSTGEGHMPAWPAGLSIGGFVACVAMLGVRYFRTRTR